MFYPLSEVPAWFRLTALLNPMTWQVDLLRFTVIGVGSPTALVLEAVAFTVFTIVCLAFAVRALENAA
jgi:ABC-type multidrug transport system permease subunit